LDDINVQAYDAPPDPLVEFGGGYSLPIPYLTRRFIGFGVSNLSPLTERWVAA